MEEGGKVGEGGKADRVDKRSKKETMSERGVGIETHTRHIFQSRQCLSEPQTNYLLSWVRSFFPFFPAHPSTPFFFIADIAFGEFTTCINLLYRKSRNPLTHPLTIHTHTHTHPFSPSLLPHFPSPLSLLYIL